MTESKYPYFKPAGDSAVLMVLGAGIDLEINRRVHALDELVLQEPLDGIVETVPAYTSLLIYYDLLRLDYHQVVDWVVLDGRFPLTFVPKLSNLADAVDDALSLHPLLHGRVARDTLLRVLGLRAEE